MDAALPALRRQALKYCFLSPVSLRCSDVHSDVQMFLKISDSSHLANTLQVSGLGPIAKTTTCVF